MTATAGTLPSPLPHPLWHPLQHARARMQRFWLGRLTPRDSMTLTQRTVYILPTRAGWMLALTLAVLLLASINFQLNLGYMLTFLLGGCAVVGMHVCHGTLRGLSLHLKAPEPQFAGRSVPLAVQLSNRRKSARMGIGLAVLGTEHWSWTDVPAEGSTTVHVAFSPTHRGWNATPPLTAETRFPLGTFRVWTVWRPAAQVLVYPTPEEPAPPLPAGEPRAGGASNAARQATGEFDGVRSYRRGDPQKLIVWKKVAKSDTLVSRDAQQAQRFELWLDLAQTSGPLERRLSRLCAWVLLADKLGLDYGLRLGEQSIAPSGGEAHRRSCLQALALYH